jgi:hypothetical protein
MLDHSGTRVKILQVSHTNLNAVVMAFILVEHTVMNKQMLMSA